MWLDGTPTIIVQEGRPKRARIEEDDVLTAARETQGSERMEQIKYAVLETSGGISIIPRWLHAFHDLAGLGIDPQPPRLIACIDNLDVVKDAISRMTQFRADGASRSVRLSDVRGLRQGQGRMAQPIAFPLFFGATAGVQGRDSDQQAPDYAHVLSLLRSYSGRGKRIPLLDRIGDAPAAVAGRELRNALNLMDDLC